MSFCFPHPHWHADNVQLGREPDRRDVALLNLRAMVDRRVAARRPAVEGVSGTPSATGGGGEQPGSKAGLTGGGEGSEPPFILSEALPVVPGKLVKKIQRGDYVDMAELLKDNVEAERRRMVAGDSGQGQRPSRREIPDFESWMQCFSAYAAVVGSKYPHKCRELWAYQALMIAEHRKCGGRGWLAYDSAFRQQIVSLEETDFSKLNHGLYSTTFLAFGGRGQFCSRCLLSDHTQEECALHPNRALPVVQFREPGGMNRREGMSSQGERKKKGRRGACFAWNDGHCPTPYCRFEHVCSKCGGDHKRQVCRGRGREVPAAVQEAENTGQSHDNLKDCELRIIIAADFG